MPVTLKSREVRAGFTSFSNLFFFSQLHVFKNPIDSLRCSMANVNVTERPCQCLYMYTNIDARTLINSIRIYIFKRIIYTSCTGITDTTHLEVAAGIAA